MKTLSQLKTDAKSGKIFARMTIRNGEECTEKNTPARLLDYRQIVDANTKSIFFMNSDGRKSELPIEKASLLEYTDDYIIIYNAGYRELNKQESAIFNEWKKKSSEKEFCARAEADALTGGTSTYWAEVAFYSKHNALYLMGSEKQGGLKYDWNLKKIQDDKIKGTISMKYEIKRT